jgi:hypothetical protein
MEPVYLNLEYFYYNFSLLLKKGYLFFVNLSSSKIVSQAQTIATILIILFIAGIIYNIRGIIAARKKKPEED